VSCCVFVLFLFEPRRPQEEEEEEEEEVVGCFRLWVVFLKSSDPRVVVC
jgi:hypothetical protein